MAVHEGRTHSPTGNDARTRACRSICEESSSWDLTSPVSAYLVKDPGNRPSRLCGVPQPAEPARLVNARLFLMGITTDNSGDVLSLLSPDVVYTVPGRGPLAGVFHGPVEVYEHIGKLFRATSGTLETLKWVDWMVGLSHVAALQFAQAQSGGVIYRNHHLYVIEAGENSLLSDIRVYFEDQTEADSFLANFPLE
jgi:hypothetical protein